MATVQIRCKDEAIKAELKSRINSLAEKNDLTQGVLLEKMITAFESQNLIDQFPDLIQKIEEFTRLQNAQSRLVNYFLDYASSQKEIAISDVTSLLNSKDDQIILLQNEVKKLNSEIASLKEIAIECDELKIRINEKNQMIENQISTIKNLENKKVDFSGCDNTSMLNDLKSQVELLNQRLSLNTNNTSI